MRRPDSRPVQPDHTREATLLAQGARLVAGVDEAGRGPLAGPVVAAAVVFEMGHIPDGLNDSKLLGAERRAELHDEIMACARVGIAVGEVDRIDRDNILQATLWAMAAAIATLPVPPCAALVDGNQRPKLACACETVVGGDGLSVSIAAASIVAKVTRDRLMERLAALHPAYAWHTNRGYSTPQHIAAIRAHGVTPHHRRSFRPVAEALGLVQAD